MRWRQPFALADRRRRLGAKRSRHVFQSWRGCEAQVPDWINRYNSVVQIMPKLRYFQFFQGPGRFARLSAGECAGLSREKISVLSSTRC
jgi:hypothetical protein